MKRLLLTIGIMLMLTPMLHASPGIFFDTRVNAHPSWTLSYNGTNWQMIFDNDATQITSTVPSDSALVDDYVDLPTMNIVGLVNHPDADPRFSYATGFLSPVAGEELTILTNSGTPTTVLRATVATGGLFVAGTDWFAFQVPDNDLHVTDYTPGYSTVLDQIVAAQTAGSQIDLGISGVADNVVDIYSLILGSQGTATGGLYGAIDVIPIPVPGALLLTGLGAMVVGWVRTRRSL